MKTSRKETIIIFLKTISLTNKSFQKSKTNFLRPLFYAILAALILFLLADVGAPLIPFVYSLV